MSEITADKKADDLNPDLGSHGTTQTTQTIAEQQEAAKAGKGDGPTAESLGVSAEQFQKYYSPEKGYNWQAHAKEAEYKLDQRGKGADAGDDKSQTSGDDKSGQQSDGQLQETAEKAGLDWDVLTNTVIETGTITADQRAALNKIGIPDNVIDDQIRFQTEAMSAHVGKVVQAFGGEQEWEDIHTQAKEKLSVEERQEIDRLLNDPDKFQLGVDLALARLGRPPAERGRVVSGPNASTGGGGDVKPFADQNELSRAIADPKYRSNSAEGVEYRNQVYKRAAVSNYQMNPRAHTGGM